MGDAPTGDDWVWLSGDTLPVADALLWAVVPSSGAVVTFCGTVRDHSEGHQGVTALEYEAYPRGVDHTLQQIIAETRQRWPETGRVALWHRTGMLPLEELAVVVVVSAPHRGEAFDAGRFCIDSVKARAPIWKREHWPDGSSWVSCVHDDPAVPA